MKGKTMNDQTRWNIGEVQQKNKQKVYEEQKGMREELKIFVSYCSVFKLQKMYEEMKRVNKGENNEKR
tara:strand:- start:240 stop:443 length:204 start_codon:yes stop_codon:yes gene_type:complete